MSDDITAITAIPRALESYPSGADQTLAAELGMRVQIEPFNAIATGVFLLAIGFDTFRTTPGMIAAMSALDPA